MLLTLNVSRTDIAFLRVCLAQALLTGYVSDGETEYELTDPGREAIKNILNQLTPGLTITTDDLKQ